MGGEKVELRDRVSLRLYDKDGNLIFTSGKKESVLDRVLRFFIKLLEDPG